MDYGALWGSFFFLGMAAVRGVRGVSAQKPKNQTYLFGDHPIHFLLF
jgi:hypothetical protein